MKKLSLTAFSIAFWLGYCIFCDCALAGELKVSDEQTKKRLQRLTVPIIDYDSLAMDQYLFELEDRVNCVFMQWEILGKMQFVYDKSEFRSYRITRKLRNVTVFQLLEDLSQSYDLVIEVADNVVRLEKTKEP